MSRLYCGWLWIQVMTNKMCTVKSQFMTTSNLDHRPSLFESGPLQANWKELRFAKVEVEVAWECYFSDFLNVVRWSHFPLLSTVMTWLPRHRLQYVCLQTALFTGKYLVHPNLLFYNDLLTIGNWCSESEWLMVLNMAKCKYVPFSPTVLLLQSSHSVNNSTALQTVESYEYISLHHVSSHQNTHIKHLRLTTHIIIFVT